MSERIGRFLRGQMATSVIYVLLGLCLICMPVGTVNIICKLVFGIILIVAGLYHILIYVMEKMNTTILDLFSGGILLVLGGFLFFNPQVVIKLLPILLGAFVLIDSIWTLQGSFRLKKKGNGMWKTLLTGSLIFVCLGIALIVNPFQIVKYTIMFAGWILLCNGAADFAFMLILHKGMKEMKEIKEMEETAEETVLEEPVSEELVSEETVLEESVSEESVLEVPVSEVPAAEENIEETE